MIDNPSSLAEHVSNLTERVATDIKQLRTDVSKSVLTVNNVAPVDGNVDVPSNVHVGTVAPEDQDTAIWIDPSQDHSPLDLSGKVDKSGDTIYGTLTFTTPTVIKREDDHTWVEICGGTGSGDGSRLVLTGQQDTDKGAWKLDARDTFGDGHWSRLLGTPTGQLTFQDKHIVRSINGTLADEEGNVVLPDATFTGGTITSDILPDANATLSLGSETKKFKSIYADEVHISQNTLYIGDTPVLGTDQNTINIKADPDQSIVVKTLGAGSTQLTSENAVLLRTNGASANINLNAAGNNSEVTLNAKARVSVNAPDIVLDGTTTITNLHVTGTTTVVNSNNLTVKDNLIEINSGETGNGVSAGTAGIKINRGDALPFLIQFDESDDMFKIGEQGDLETIASHDYVDTKIEQNKYTHPATHSASMITGLSAIATTGKFEDLVDKPEALPASGGNADTVNGFTVAANVPADAKFTDTIYTLPDATDSVKGGVKIGSNITVSAGIISLTKGNVTSALGYTPPEKDTTYSAATQAVAGLMSTDDKKKLDGIAAGANAYVHPSYTSKANGLYKVTVDATGHVSATTAVTKDDITGLGIPAQDTVYTLPAANSTTLGGVKVGNNITVSSGTISLTKSNVTTALGYTPPEKDTVYTHPATHAASMITGLADVATSGNYSDLSGVPTSLPADGGNADTVSGFTVGTNVPVDAKFTDTTYSTGTATTSGLTKLYTGTGTNTDGTLTQSAITSALNGKLDASANAVSASKLATARTITLGGDASGSVSFDGSENKTLTVTIADDSHNHIISNVDGLQDALDAKLDATAKAASAAVADSANAVTWTNVSGKPTSFTPSSHNQASNTITAMTGYSKPSATGAIAATDSLNAAVGKLEKALDGKLASTANAVSASKWANARTITLGGDASGSVSIDGSANATLTVTVTDDSHNHVISNVDGLQTALDGKASTGSVTTALADAKSYTDTKIAALIDTAPETLDTLGEVAEALAANEDVVDALNAAVGTKANDADVVKLSGNQTIAGTKTFSGTIVGSISGNAATATKATQDGSGNVITATYATKAAASTTTAGLMSADDKKKLDGIATGANAYVHPSYTAKTSGLYKVAVDATGHVSATTAVTKADITGLGIPAQDTVYTLPAATSSALGGVKVGNNITVSSGTISLTKANVTTALGYTPPTQDTVYTHPATHAASMITGLATVATSGKYSDLSGTPTSLPANGGNAATVGGFTVGTNVPANAKFTDTVYTLPTAGSSLGGVKTTSTVTSTSGLTACPIINGVPYYKDTKNTYTLSSFSVTATASELNVLDGITATTAELNYVDGVTSNIQTQLNGKLSTSGTAAKATADASGNTITSTYATKSEVEDLVTAVGEAFTEFGDTIVNSYASADSYTQLSSRIAVLENALKDVNSSSKIVTEDMLLADYLRKVDAANTYVTPTQVQDQFITSTEVANLYLTKDEAANKYLTKSEATTMFLTRADYQAEIDSAYASLI